jgi:hypothetical protein
MDEITLLLKFLRQFIYGIVVDAMAQNTAVQQEPPKKDEDPFFTVKELHDYLPGNTPIPTIYGWCCKRTIPYHKIGRWNVFRKSEIDGWLSLKAIQTTDEIASTPIPSKKRK